MKEFVFNGLTGTVNADGLVRYNNAQYQIKTLTGALAKAAERALEQLNEEVPA